MNRSLARYRLQQRGYSRLATWFLLLIFTTRETPMHRNRFPGTMWPCLLTVIVGIIAIIAALATPASARSAPLIDAPEMTGVPEQWTLSVVIVDHSAPPDHSRGAYSPRLPDGSHPLFFSFDECEELAQAAVDIFLERLREIGYDMIEVERLICTRIGPPDTISTGPPSGDTRGFVPA